MDDGAALDLSGKGFVVLGGTGVIGSAIATRILRSNGRVIVTGRNDEELRRLEDAGAVGLRITLAEIAMDSSVLNRVCEHALWECVDGLVLSTGSHGPIGPTRLLNATDLREYLNENLVALISVIGSLAPLLDKSTSPAVVGLSGGGATGPRANYSAYAAAKVALIRVLENVAIEEPRWRVNAVAPGFVASPIHHSSIAAGVQISGETPEAIRMRMETADDPNRAAKLVALLLSDQADGLTGRLISAIWDDWNNSNWRQNVAASPSLARVRRDDRFA